MSLFNNILNELDGDSIYGLTPELKGLFLCKKFKKEIDTKDYVLGKFSKEEKEKLEEFKPKSIEIIDDYFEMEFSKLMILNGIILSLERRKI